MGEERTRKKNEGKQEANRRKKAKKVERVRGKVEKGHTCFIKQIIFSFTILLQWAAKDSSPL